MNIGGKLAKDALDNLLPQNGAYVPSTTSQNLGQLAPQNAVNGSTPSVEHAIQRQAHAELVQRGIFGLLLDIAPMVLLAPDIKVEGSPDVAHAVLDPNHLTLEHPVVQFGLSSFFTKLASNPFVKKAMAGAVNIGSKLAKDALDNLLPQNGANAPSNEPQNPGQLAPQNAVNPSVPNPPTEVQHFPGDKLANLVAALTQHPNFKQAITTMVVTASEDLTTRGISRVFDGPSERELALRRRMDHAVTRMLIKLGEDASEQIVYKMEHLWEKSE